MFTLQLEREVSALQQQQVAVLARLRQSQDESGAVRDQLASVSDALRKYIRANPEISDVCAKVDQVG